MKKLIVFFLFVGSSAFAQVKNTRSVADFDKILVSQSIKVEYKYGGTKNVEVEVEKEEDLQYVKTVVTNAGQLKIFIENPNKIRALNLRNIRVSVTNPKLKEVIVSSSALFNLKSDIKVKEFTIYSNSSGKFEGRLVQADNLIINASSSSTVKGNFTVLNQTTLHAISSSVVDVYLSSGNLNIQSSSSSKVKLIGKSNAVTANVTSSGSVENFSFISKKLDAKVSSSGSLSLGVSDELSAVVTSSGKVEYKGYPKTINKSVSSGGKVVRVD